MEKIDTELTDVTPDMARKWLGFNTHNRNVRGRVVAGYATDMRNGDWRVNGETIKFSADGTLLDGQHRLHAVIEADVPVRMLIVRGLDAATQDTMDDGVTRKFSDALRLRGIGQYVVLAAVVRRVAQWEAAPEKAPEYSFSANVHPTKAQLFATLEAHPALYDIAKHATASSRDHGLPPALTGLCMWLFSQLPNADEDTEFFFARLADFQGLVKGDPIYELRKAIENSRDVRGQKSAKYLTAITIKAWNAFRKGEKVGLLRFTTGGAHPEKFPEPI